MTPVWITPTTSERVAAIKGRLFYLTTGVRLVAKREFLIIQLTNLSGLGEFINLGILSVSVSESTTLEIIKNASFSAAGISLTPRNSNTNAADNSIAAVKYLIQHTDPIADGQLLASYFKTQGIIEVFSGGAIKIGDGATLILRVFNNSNKASSVSVTFNYFESK
jgi:hypothetical protein